MKLKKYFSVILLLASFFINNNLSKEFKKKAASYIQESTWQARRAYAKKILDLFINH